MLNLRQRASSFGFTYKPAEELVASASLEELFERLKVLGPTGSPMTPKEQRDADAVLGATKRPRFIVFGRTEFNRRTTVRQ